LRRCGYSFACGKSILLGKANTIRGLSKPPMISTTHSIPPFEAIKPVQRRETSTGSKDEKETRSRNDSQGKDFLNADQRAEVAKLKARDAEVRAHEAAHLAAAGQYAQGGASYTYQVGPDGKRYAIGGEVSISTSKERTPEATIAKAQQIRAAAMAPADPSPQDARVAAKASAMMAAAQRELNEARMTEADPDREVPGQAQRVEQTFAPRENAPVGMQLWAAA